MPENETLLAETHMPYVLGAGQMAKFRDSSLDPAFRVRNLPGYAITTPANRFTALRDLPLEGRYHFLLDEAECFVMNFIRGPVCRGQLVLDVIEDRLWAFFVDPRAGANNAGAEFPARERDDLRMPAERGSTSPILTSWLEHPRLEQLYLRAKSQALEQAAAKGVKIDLSLIWNGDGGNANAVLTVFRHLDSASVVKGLAGDAQKTAWVIDYPLLERVYYLLVVGYDVYGHAGHQLNSRPHMDCLRVEVGSNFPVLLPQSARGPTAGRWYSGAPREVTDNVCGRDAHFHRPNDIANLSGNPQRGLQSLPRARPAPVLAPRFELSTVPDATLRSDLRDTAHKNVAHVFKETQELLPAENTLTVVPGFIGAYPNAIFSLRPGEVAAFMSAVAALASEADCCRLAVRFAIRRTHPGFRSVSDESIEAYAAWTPAEAGLFDYGRPEKR